MIEAIKEVLKGIDQTELESTDGWWETSAGAEFGAKKLKYILGLLAQPEQEPVAWMLEGWGPDCGPYFEIYRDDEMGWRNKKEWTPLYTTPPQRTWVGLTDEEIADCAEKMEASDPTDSFWREFFRGIEAKLKEKNT
jgi:hypothetical protein